MLETIAAVGTLASGLGKLFGSKGKGSSTPATPSLDTQLATQSAHGIAHEEKAFNQKMALAKQHGLHPLSVLGVPMSTFAPAVTSGAGGGSETDWSGVGDGISQAAKAFVKPPEAAAAPELDPLMQLHETRMRDAQVRTAEAQAKKLEWEAQIAEQNASRILTGQPGNPPAVRISNDVSATGRLAAAQAGVSPAALNGSGVTLKQEITPPHPSILGHGLGADQSFQRMVDSTGNFYSMVNPNAFSLDFEQPGTFNYLANKYGAERAMNYMALIEQFGPIAGGAAALGSGAAGAYVWHQNRKDQAREDRLNSRTRWRMPPSRPNQRMPF